MEIQTPKLSRERHLDQLRKTAKEFKGIQKLRVQMGNSEYAWQLESAIGNTSYWPKIKELRRNREKQKEVQRLIKKALEENGLTNDDIKRKSKEALSSSESYGLVKKAERVALKILKAYIEPLRIYQGFLKQVRGIDVCTAAQLVGIVGNIERFKTVSKLWKYFGLAPGQKLRRGEQLDYNPDAKALICGIVGPNFLRADSQYRVVYDKRTEKTKRLKPEIWHMNSDGTKKKGKNMHPKHGYKDGIHVTGKRFLAEFWKASYLAQDTEPPTLPYGASLPNHHLESDIVSFQEPTWP
jgi:Transposase IS116/IS110/IS902 family.